MSVIFDEMVESGNLTQEEYNLLTTPLSKLGEKVPLAMAVSDKVCRYISNKNKHFVPSYSGRIQVISDYIGSGAVKSMVDGKMYDSKSKYYRSLKENGCFINESPVAKTQPQISEISGKDIKNAIERFKSR
jgi:hypothetical protein